MIAFDDALRTRVVGNLAAHPRWTAPDGEQRHAAVAVVVVPSEAGTDSHDPHAFSAEEMQSVPGDLDGFDGSVTHVAGGAALVLCRRAATLRSHGGQWALPGGRVDPGETVEQAALRELHEELGLLLTAADIVGRLDDFVTRSGYVMSPVVMFAPGQVELVPNPAEVAHAYRIGLHELCRADSPRLVTIPESDRPVVQVPLGRDLIHAPTAAVLLGFRWVGLEGRLGERVHHFEQPVFAWK